MNEKDFKKFVQDHTLDENLNYLGNAFAGEAGEVCNVIKRFHVKERIEHYRKGLERDIVAGIRQPLEDNIKDELGDVLFYMTAIMNQFDLSLSDIRDHQENKIIGKSIAYGESFLK